MKLLERRLRTAAQFQQLQNAVQQWSQNGGHLTIEVVAEDAQASPFVYKHRVLAVCFRLKSKAFMLTYNSAAFTPASWDGFRDFIVGVANQFGAAARR